MLPPTEKNLSLEEQNAALREEIRQSRTSQVVANAQQAHAQDEEQRQARFRTVFENSPFGQKIITSDLTIRQANQQVVAMFGCERPDELIGHKILEFAHPDHREDWQHLQQRLWEHKLPAFALETYLVRRDGSCFWCQVTSIRFPDGDEELGYTQLEDISDRKALELSLKRLYDAQESNLHLATHDLRMPLAHIELLTHLLQREVDAVPEPKADLAREARNYLNLIRRACAEANKLLKDVLLVGMLDAHHLQKQPTNFNAFLQKRLQPHVLAAQAKELALVLDLPELPLQANLNADIFGRVVDNLLSNALKFTPTGGTITVGLQERAGRVVLSVRDTGIGIPQALQAQLFEKFSPSSRSGLAGETSTGLGLFITRQIVQLHRGKLWVRVRKAQAPAFLSS